jgi:hypothetical protein
MDINHGQNNRKTRGHTRYHEAEWATRRSRKLKRGGVSLNFHTVNPADHFGKCERNNFTNSK